jgi:hypothetical protein
MTRKSSNAVWRIKPGLTTTWENDSVEKNNLPSASAFAVFQGAHEVRAGPCRLGPPRKLDLRVGGQAAQHDRLKRGWCDAEIDLVPAVGRPHGGVEPQADRVLARAVHDQHEAARLGAHAPFRGRRHFGEGNRAGQKIERAAFGVLHLRRGSEREARPFIAQLADQLATLERNGGRRRIRGRRNNRVGADGAQDQQARGGEAGQESGNAAVGIDGSLGSVVFHKPVRPVR